MTPNGLYKISEEFLGIQEIPGSNHAPEILEMFAQSGHSWVQDDETPWCAAFVGMVLAVAGIQGTNSLAARSYLDWGEEVAPEDVQQGDIVVLWRGSPSSWQGHVGFVHAIREDTVEILGGNQGNAVNIQAYPLSRVLGYRRVKAPRTTPTQSRTIQATAVQIAGGATAGVTAIGSLDGTAQVVTIIGAALIIIAAMVVFRERLLKWNKGDR